jgi:Ca2+-transporting ATPase
VLLDDDFSSIVGAVRAGRKIFDNIKKAVTYIMAVHMPIAGLSLIPVILGWPLILLPVHIAFLELIIDPSCSVVFEAEVEESDLMDRPPRDPKTPLFNRSMLLSSLFQGLSVLAVVLALEGIAWSRGMGESAVRSLTFTTLVIANLGLILANRSWSRTIMTMFRSRNTALVCVAGGTLAFLALALYAPFMQNLFRFAPLHPNDLAVCFGVGLFSIAWLEALKFLNRPSYRMKP